MPYSTDIKDYYRRAWGLGDRASFKYGGSWADWQTNFSDQMTFEEYLRMDLKEKKPHFLDEKADGGRIGFADGPPKPIEMKYIGEVKNVKKEVVGYKVQVTKTGGGRGAPKVGSFTEIFYFEDYPSKEVALEAAKAQRNVVVKKFNIKSQDPAMQGLDPQTYEKLYRAKPEQIEKRVLYHKLPEVKVRNKLANIMLKAKDPEEFRKKKRIYTGKIRETKGLSDTDLKVLDKVRLRLKYQQAHNDIIIANKGLNLPSTEITPRKEALLKNDPVFVKLYNKIYPGQPFELSGKDLDSSTFKRRYNLTLKDTKRIPSIQQMFENQMEAVFLEELGTPEAVQNFKNNDFRFNETKNAQNISRTTGSMHRRIKALEREGVGFTETGRKAYLTDPYSGGNQPSLINKALGIGHDPNLKFDRAHFFSRTHANTLNNLGLLSDKAVANFQELFTYKPSIVNALERAAYDNPIREALIDYQNAKHSDHNNLKALENKFRIAYQKATRLGLDVDLASLNQEGKFEFKNQFGRTPQSSMSVGKKGHLLANALNEIGNINSASKGLSESTIRQIKIDFPKTWPEIKKHLETYERMTYDQSKLTSAMKKRINQGLSNPIIERGSPLGRFYEKVVPTNVKAAMPGTVKGGVGVLTGALFAHAADQMWQSGRSKKDIAGLPVDFATFGIVPASDIIRGKRLSSEMEPEKFKKYMDVRATEADVGGVGLEEIGYTPTRVEGGAESLIEDTEVVRGEREKAKLRSLKNLETFKKIEEAEQEAMFKKGGLSGVDQYILNRYK